MSGGAKRQCVNATEPYLRLAGARVGELLEGGGLLAGPAAEGAAAGGADA
jgi:hypothetical protein